MNNSSTVTFLIIFACFLIVFVVLYLFMGYRKMKKQRDAFQELQLGLEEGQNVSLSNGIYGTIVRLDKETADIEIKSGAVMTVSRFAISRVMDEKEPEKALPADTDDIEESEGKE